LNPGSYCDEECRKHLVPDTIETLRNAHCPAAVASGCYGLKSTPSQINLCENVPLNNLISLIGSTFGFIFIIFIIIPASIRKFRRGLNNDDAGDTIERQVNFFIFKI
jgi:hypothetical protein